MTKKNVKFGNYIVVNSNGTAKMIKVGGEDEFLVDEKGFFSKVKKDKKEK